MVRQCILWPGTSSLTYAKRRKWIIGFEGLCGSIWLPGTPGPQKDKAWMDIRAQCTHPNVTRIQWGGSQLYFWSDSGISAVVCFGGWGKPKGDEQQKHPSVTNPESQCAVGIDYCSRKYSMTQKGTDGFWCVCHEHWENGTAVYLSRNLGRFHWCRIAVDWRSASANFYTLQFPIAA